MSKLGVPYPPTVVLTPADRNQIIEGFLSRALRGEGLYEQVQDLIVVNAFELDNAITRFLLTSDTGNPDDRKTIGILSQGVEGVWKFILYHNVTITSWWVQALQTVLTERFHTELKHGPYYTRYTFNFKTQDVQPDLEDLL